MKKKEFQKAKDEAISKLSKVAQKQPATYQGFYNGLVYSMIALTIATLEQDKQ